MALIIDGEINSNLSRAEIMRKNGFDYDSKFNGFVKKGYGMFLTNTNDFSEHENYLSKMCINEFYTDYIRRGYVLVVGPAAPADDGKFYSKSAVYIKNYEEIQRNNFETIKKEANNRTDINDSEKELLSKVKLNIVNNSNTLTNDEISSIIRRFQLLINNYEIAICHRFYGINVYDIALEKLYSYEEEISKKYKNQDLYNILVNLKTNLTGKESCKEHIFYTLGNSLFQQVTEDNFVPSNEKIEYIISLGLSLINCQKNIQEPPSNFNKDPNNTINNIDDFLEKAKECTLEEKCRILYSIDKYFSDKNRSLPKSAVSIIIGLREGIFEDKYIKRLKYSINPK